MHRLTRILLISILVNNTLLGTFNAYASTFTPEEQEQLSVNCAPYMNELRQKVTQTWESSTKEYLYSQTKDYSGRALVIIVVAKDGQLSKVSLSQPSHNEAIDQYALNAVKQSAPFKPFPTECFANYLHLEMNFDYEHFADYRNWLKKKHSLPQAYPIRQ